MRQFCYERKKDWDIFVSAVLFAYRTLKHSSTKFEPYHLLYGKKPVIPVEIDFPTKFIAIEASVFTEREIQRLILDRAKQFAKGIEQIRNTAKMNIRTSQDLQKRRYDEQLKI